MIDTTEEQSWITSFNKTSEILLGIDVVKFAEMKKKNNEVEMNELYSNAYGNIFNLKCLISKTEYGNGFEVVMKNCVEEIKMDEDGAVVLVEKKKEDQKKEEEAKKKEVEKKKKEEEKKEEEKKKEDEKKKKKKI